VELFINDHCLLAFEGALENVAEDQAEKIEFDSTNKVYVKIYNAPDVPGGRTIDADDEEMAELIISLSEEIGGILGDINIFEELSADYREKLDALENVIFQIRDKAPEVFKKWGDYTSYRQDIADRRATEV